MNALHFDFVHDDLALIVHNPSIHRWDNIFDYFFSTAISFQTHSVSTPYFRPFLEILNRLQYLIFGMNPAGFHLVNLLIHSFNGFLIFKVLQRLGVHSVSSCFIALIFLVHPIQSQPVAAIAGISNLITATFMLLVVLSFFNLEYNRFAIINVILYFSFALLCKEHAVMTPIFLIMCYAIFRREFSDVFKKRSKWALLLLILITGAYVFWRLFFLTGGEGASPFGASYEFWRRILTIPQIVLTFMRLVVCPTGLHYYRSVDFLSPWLGSFLIVLMLAVSQWMVGYKKGNSRRMLFLGWGWFLLFLAPVLNIIPLVNEYSYLSVSEHFLYLPIVGLLIVIIHYFEIIRRNFSWCTPKICVLISVLILLVLTALTIRQNEQWRSEQSLFERTVQYEPHLGRVQQLMGNVYFRQGHLDKALSHYQQAESIFSRYIKQVQIDEVRELYAYFLKAIFISKGHVYLRLDELDQSIVFYEKALEIKGHFPGENDHMVYHNLSVHYHRLGQYDKAQEYFLKAKQTFNEGRR